MSLQQDIMTALKEAMKAKDQTETGAKTDLTEEQELKILQKQVKQRKDSAAVYIEQGREDLAAPELAEAEIIGKFLPEALSEADIEKVVVAVIAQVGAEGMKDMGKVMGLVSEEVAGRADGKTISTIVRQKLA